MSSPFPSSSAQYTELRVGQYDTVQLAKAVTAAIELRAETGQGDIPAAPARSSSSDLQPEASTSSNFHLHTLSLQCSLNPPEQMLRYWRTPDRPNPEYEAFSTFRDDLRTAVAPFAPLALMPSTPRMLRFPQGTASRQADTIELFLTNSHAKRPLIWLAPSIKPEGKQWMPSSSMMDMQNWMHAALALDPDEKATRRIAYRDDKRRVSLETGVQICWVPDSEGEKAGAEIKLLVTVDVYLDMAVIYDPLPDTGKDMLGLILHSLIPAPPTAKTRSESEARASALRHFLACLRPAPHLHSDSQAASLQPKEMVSRLLPFQARTVAVLLQREGSSIRDVKPTTSADPTGFWNIHDFGKSFGRVAYRRVTGDMLHIGPSRAVQVTRKGKGKASDQAQRRSLEEMDELEQKLLPTVLDLSGVKGTMLCEEMGLGKTVEAIALILLRRHPRSTPRLMPAPQAAVEEPESSTSSTPKAKGKSRDPGTPNRSKKAQRVPAIDLLRGPFEADDSEMRRWSEAETAAFEGKTAWDEAAQLHVTEVGTTLVVTPPSLLKQWVSEMQAHAPSMRVCVYEGWKSLQKGLEKQRAAYNTARTKSQKRNNEEFRKETVRKYARLNGGRRVKVEIESDSAYSEQDEEEDSLDSDFVEESSLERTRRLFVDYVRAHDVVVTTYYDLAQDLKVAVPAPPRARRSNANYQPGERPRSPLVMVEWWRVIMDEVQLQGDQSASANMVSLIPRRNSLAVSGTPAKNDIKDLMGSLKFLRVPVLPYKGHMWHRLQQPAMRPAFEGLFRTLAVRTTKKEVAGEFSLPSQSRYIVPIDLSEIELHYYNDTLDRQHDLLRLPGDMREARASGWEVDRTILRSCLLNLRQICTHIQVGQMQAGVGRRDQRLRLGRQLMTMAEALEKMRDDHSQEFLTESRLQLRAMVRKAQLVTRDEEDSMAQLKAVALYEKVRDRVNKQLGPVREHLFKLIGNREDSIDDRTDIPDRNLSQQEREKQQAITAARQAIREMLIIQHQSWFFEGDVHHVIKEEEQEISCYAQADAFRKEILTRPLALANSSVAQLDGALERSHAIDEIGELQTEDTKARGGLLSNNTIVQANELLKIMNGNAELVFNWRRKIIQLLSSPIEADSGDLTNVGKGQDVENPEAEYYAEALKAQGDVEAYLIAYASAVADRKEFLSEERSLLATHEARVAKLRVTQAAKNAMEDIEIANIPDEVAEQAAQLMAERQAFRTARLNNDCKRPLKALLMELNSVIFGQHRPEEIAIAQTMVTMLKAYIPKQSDYVEKLNKELEVFRATFNRRVVYFAALQEISDSVSAPEFKDIKKEIAECSTEIDELELKLTRMVVKGRFLQFLGTREDGQEELKEDCIICMGSSDDTQAVLLECGHFFCISCFRELRRSVQGRRCPQCRTEINDKEITKIKLSGGDKAAEKPIELQLADEASMSQEQPSESPEEAERRRRQADMEKLRMTTVDRRREVALMDMMGEYGSKINFLIKHLLHYKFREPDARHVIFSNWSDSLNIVIQALTQNGISFVSFDQGKKSKNVVDRFIKDTSISVFLLHAERESSGLTLTSCRVVHLLEPVLRHSFELQAIGRVDRLGQKEETTVFCYATMETVESRILSQGVRNGTSIYLKDENADTVVASMPNVVSAAHKGGDLSNDGNEEELLELIL